MGYSNLLQGSSSTGGERGPRGVAGRGVASIQTIDNNDGSVTLTFNMTDETTESVTNTLVSDSLIDLNKIELSGTEYADKFNIKNAAETTLFNVATTGAGVVYSKNLYVAQANYTTISEAGLSVKLGGTNMFNVDADNNKVKVNAESFSVDVYTLEYAESVLKVQQDSTKIRTLLSVTDDINFVPDGSFTPTANGEGLLFAISDPSIGLQQPFYGPASVYPTFLDFANYWSTTMMSLVPGSFFEMGLSKGEVYFIVRSSLSTSQIQLAFSEDLLIQMGYVEPTYTRQDFGPPYGVVGLFFDGTPLVQELDYQFGAENPIVEPTNNSMVITSTSIGSSSGIGINMASSTTMNIEAPIVTMTGKFNSVLTDGLIIKDGGDTAYFNSSNRFTELFGDIRFESNPLFGELFRITHLGDDSFSVTGTTTNIKNLNGSFAGDVFYANANSELTRLLRPIVNEHVLFIVAEGFPVWKQTTSSNVISTIVQRDASGDFSAGTIIASLSGNASSSTVLQTARTINTVSFNGSANISTPLSGCSDVVISLPAEGQVLVYDGVTSKWQNMGQSTAQIFYNPLSGTAPSVVTNLTTANNFYPVVLTSLVWSTSNMVDFSLVSNVLRYTGTKTKTFRITGSVTIEPANADRDFRIVLAKSNSVYPTLVTNIIAQSYIAFSQKDASPNQGSVNMSFLASLATNDYLQLGFSCLQNNQDVNINTTCITCVELR